MTRSLRTWVPLVSCTFAVTGMLCTALNAAADARAPVHTAVLSDGGPCPAGPTATPISVAVDRGYLGFRDVVASGAPCTLTLDRGFPKRVAGDPPDTATGTVELAFTNAGLQIHFTLQQPVGLTKTVPFAGIDLNADDNINILLKPRASATAFGRSFFTATVNAAGKCSSLNDTPGFQLNHGQCSAAPDDADAALAAGKGQCCWAGLLTIPYDTLIAAGMPTEFAVRIERIVRVSKNRADHYYSGGPALKDDGAWVPVVITGPAVAQHERYLGGASNIGFNPSMPPHRVAATAFLPIDPHDAVLATFADDSGPILTLRDKTLKDIFGSLTTKLANDQLSNFTCVSCASFQTDRTAAFDPPVTSQNVLGADFSSLGVDSVPFAFDAAGYPIDSGFKGFFADQSVAFATMNGTTSSNGAARDTIARLMRRFDWGTQTLRFGLDHAVANRSIATPDATGTFPPIVSTLRHSTNTEASLGYSYAITHSDTGSPSFTTQDSTILSALARYGTQYAGQAQRVDLALSAQVLPPFANTIRQPGSLPTLLAVIGYRSLGPAYGAIDADFDPIAGLHGVYGTLSYAEPNPEKAGFSGISITAHRFSDAFEARDVALTTSASVRLGKAKHFALAGGFTTGTVAASQAARLSSTPFVVTDNQAGATYLPNSSYSLSVTSMSATHELSIGYTQGRSPSCDPTTAGLPPCFAFRQPSVTATVFWLPFSDVFVVANIKNRNDNALSLVSGGPVAGPAVTGSGQDTTAGHIVRNAAVGAYLFNGKCSTLTVSTENRGGSFETFSQSPPKPGFTNTAALELVPAANRPTILVAYSRIGTLGQAPATQFLVRARIGLPERAFRADVRQGCAGR